MGTAKQPSVMTQNFSGISMEMLVIEMSTKMSNPSKPQNYYVDD